MPSTPTPMQELEAGRTDRESALFAAVQLFERRFGKGHRCDRNLSDLLDTADLFYDWLTATVTLTLAAGPAVDQTTGTITDTPTGVPQMQLHDNEQVDLTVTTADAKGFATSDTITWTSSDETVVTVTVSADSKTGTAVAGNPGSAVITISDGTLTATEAIDVVAAGTATINVAEGTPVGQAAAPATGDGSTPANPGDGTTPVATGTDANGNPVTPTV